MKRLKIIVEGGTEEMFVNECLVEYLYSKRQYIVVPLIIPTSQKNGKLYKGGFRRKEGYDYAAKWIAEFIKTDTDAVYSTMFDFYGFPEDIDCYKDIQYKEDIYQQACLLEKYIYNDVLKRVNKRINFIPYIAMHEFESVLFVNPEAYKGYGVTQQQIEEIIDISKMYKTPEHINNSYETAPSKRLQKIISGYRKKKHGAMYAGLIGIDEIRNKCIHFNNWMLNLENLEK